MKTKKRLVKIATEDANQEYKISIIHCDDFINNESVKIAQWMNLLNSMAGIIKEVNTRCKSGDLTFPNSISITFFKLQSTVTNGHASISYFICFDGMLLSEDDIAIYEIDSLLRPEIYIGESYNDVKLFSKSEQYDVEIMDSNDFFKQTMNMFDVSENKLITVLEQHILNWYLTLFENKKDTHITTKEM